MKKLVLTLLAFTALTFTGLSQAAAPKQRAGQVAPNPETKAEKEAGQATKKFGLNETQRVKFKQYSLERINANKPLRQKMNAATDQATKDNLEKQIKANRDIFFENVKAIMTPEQQVKWAESRKKFEEKKAQEEHHD
jgi:hypothetical protein